MVPIREPIISENRIRTIADMDENAALPSSASRSGLVFCVFIFCRRLSIQFYSSSFGGWSWCARCQLGRKIRRRSPVRPVGAFPAVGWSGASARLSAQMAQSWRRGGGRRAIDRPLAERSGWQPAGSVMPLARRRTGNLVDRACTLSSRLRCATGTAGCPCAGLVLRPLAGLGGEGSVGSRTAGHNTMSRPSASNAAAIKAPITAMPRLATLEKVAEASAVFRSAEVRRL